MSSLEELEQRIAAMESDMARVTAMESEIAVVRQEAAAARALAAGADRDVAEYRAELRGHTRVLGALRETQLEQGRAIIRLSATVGHIRDQHGASLAHITDLLSQLIERDDGPEGHNPS